DVPKKQCTGNEKCGNNLRSRTAVKNPANEGDQDFARVRSRRFQIERKGKGSPRPAWTRGEGSRYVRGRAAGRLSAFHSTRRGGGCARRVRTWNCCRWLWQRRSDDCQQSERGA